MIDTGSHPALRRTIEKRNAEHNEEGPTLVGGGDRGDGGNGVRVGTPLGGRNVVDPGGDQRRPPSAMGVRQPWTGSQPIAAGYMYPSMPGCGAPPVQRPPSRPPSAGGHYPQPSPCMANISPILHPQPLPQPFTLNYASVDPQFQGPQYAAPYGTLQTPAQNI